MEQRRREPAAAVDAPPAVVGKSVQYGVFGKAGT
jgi:hypothetical protein